MAVQTGVGNCAGRVGWMRASTAGTLSASELGFHERTAVDVLMTILCIYGLEHLFSYLALYPRPSTQAAIAR
jgi:hypothetical protein